MNTRLPSIPAPRVAVAATGTSRAHQLVSDLIALTKPKVQILLLLTTVAAMFAAGDPSPELALLTMLGGALSAGGASAINHWYDRDIDAIMSRTQDRPVPSGRMSANVALWVGIGLSVASIAVFWIFTNPAATILSFAGLAWYVGIYTMWLKRRSKQNIVIGGAAGAFPPMVGWAATTGHFTWISVVPFAIIFAWTAPHFWALSLLIKDQYAAAKVPMLPVVDGEKATFKAIVNWSWITLATSLVPTVLIAANLIDGNDARPFGIIYTAAAVILGGELVRRSYALKRHEDRGRTLALHLYALAYLALLFAAMVLSAQLAI